MIIQGFDAIRKKTNMHSFKHGNYLDSLCKLSSLT